MAPETGDEAFDRLVQQNWRSIHSWYRRMRVMNILNIRSSADNNFDDAWIHLLDAWKDVNTRIKINCSLGLILEHRVTGELRYFHSSSNNASEFAAPRLISSEAQLRTFFDDLQALNLRDSAS